MKDLAQQSEAVVTDILRLMGIAADVQTTVGEDGTLHVSIETRGLDDIVIGRGGETLQSLEYVVLRVVNREFSDERVSVSIDVGGYLDRRDDELVDLAHQLAQKLRETNREQLTDLLPAAERRTIHRALAEVGGLTTYSIGDGMLKRLVVSTRDAEPFVEPRERDRDRERGGRRERGGGERPGRDRRDARGERPRGGRSERESGGQTPAPSSDGRVRDLISAEKQAAGLRRPAFRIVSLPPGFSSDSAKGEAVDDE